MKQLTAIVAIFCVASCTAPRVKHDTDYSASWLRAIKDHYANNESVTIHVHSNDVYYVDDTRLTLSNLTQMGEYCELPRNTRIILYVVDGVADEASRDPYYAIREHFFRISFSLQRLRDDHSPHLQNAQDN